MFKKCTRLNKSLGSRALPSIKDPTETSSTNRPHFTKCNTKTNSHEVLNTIPRSRGLPNIKIGPNFSCTKEANFTIATPKKFAHEVLIKA
jgi:hypothetical protein